MPERSAYTLRLPGEVVLGLSSTGCLDLYEDERLLLGAYLPEVHIEDGLAGDVEVHIRHVESTDVGLTQGSREIELRDEWNNAYSPDLPFLLSSVARSLWLQRGIYPVHAACVGDNALSLLPGGSGAGKSTVSLEAVTNHGQKMFSGNTTLIRFLGDGMEALAGTRTMTLITADFNRRRYDVTHSVTYGDRTAFQLEPECYAPAAAQYADRRVGQVALVRLADRTPYWQRLTPASVLHRLYPQFLDTAREDTVFADGTGLYAGWTPAMAKRSLVKGLQAALTDVSVWHGTGDAQYLAQRLAGS